MENIRNIRLVKTEPIIGSRIAACIIDYGVLIVFNFVFIHSAGEPDNLGGYHVHGWPTFIPFLVWLFWIVGMEQLVGATIGNNIAGIKPVSIRGRTLELSFGQSLKRHLVDCVDMFFFGLIGVILVLKTSRNQRLGDLWADTIVVRKDFKLETARMHTNYNH